MCKLLCPQRVKAWSAAWLKSERKPPGVGDGAGGAAAPTRHVMARGVHEALSSASNWGAEERGAQP